MDRHIQYRLPDGSYVNESSDCRQRGREQGKSQIVRHRFRAFPDSDRYSVCIGYEPRLVPLCDPSLHIHCGRRADSGSLALLPASGHFIRGALERAGLDIHSIDHDPLRRRKPLDHVYPELPNDVRMPETIKKYLGFQKASIRGKTLLQKGFPPDPLSENSHMFADGPRSSERLTNPHTRSRGISRSSFRGDREVFLVPKLSGFGEIFRGTVFSAMDYCSSSGCRRRNDFQKADRQGKNPFATQRVSPWTLFPKTPKWVRSGHEPVTGSLTRTRPEGAYLGVFGVGSGEGLFAKSPYPGKHPALRTACQNYLLVAKPGIVLGNLISAAAGFFLASKGRVDGVALLATLIGISLVVASGCVFNNCIDRELDRKMIRTRNRALAKGLISLKSAVSYATILGIAGMALLWAATNLLSVVITLAGLLIYVGVYSLYMKRNSVYSTLIGSLAGAAPPLAGYCAVTGRLRPGSSDIVVDLHPMADASLLRDLCLSA